MITFGKLFFKNFLGVGERGMEIDLDTKNKILITGKNGSGKSTFLCALTYALYGKSYRGINKPQLPNSTNKKNCVVTLDLSTSASEYRIVRGMNPSVFDVWENGQKIDSQTSVGDLQTWVESNVIKMSFQTFIQVVVLGAANYVPFMKLTTAQRRTMSESLLDVEVFTTMNNLLKTRIAENDEQVKLAKQAVSFAEANIETVKQMMTAHRGDKEVELSNLKDRGIKLSEEVFKIKNDLSERSSCRDQLKSLQTQLFNLKSTFISHEDAVKKISEREDFFAHSDHCSVCEQSISRDHKDSIFKRLREERDNEENAAFVLPAKIDMLKSAVDEAQRTVYKFDAETATLAAKESSLKDIATEYSRLKTFLDSDASTSNNATLQEAESALVEASTKHSDLSEQQHVLKVCSQLLKDSGIKASIVKQYIPVLNSLINRYLEEFEFFVKFEFDEQFNETIKGRSFNDYSYKSFSMGERMRIDLAMLFAWREIAAMRAKANTNLIIFDEIFDSSLDDVGSDDLMRVLTGLSQKCTAIVISHRGDQLIDKMDDHIQIEKVNGFSKIVET